MMDILDMAGYNNPEFTKPGDVTMFLDFKESELISEGDEDIIDMVADVDAPWVFHEYPPFMSYVAIILQIKYDICFPLRNVSDSMRESTERDIL